MGVLSFIVLPLWDILGFYLTMNVLYIVSTMPRYISLSHIIRTLSQSVLPYRILVWIKQYANATKEDIEKQVSIQRCFHMSGCECEYEYECGQWITPWTDRCKWNRTKRNCDLPSTIARKTYDIRIPHLWNVRFNREGHMCKSLVYFNF